MRNYLQVLKLSEFKASALALLASNLMLLLGTLIFRWEVFPIVAVYWAENLVVGLINVLKIITCEAPPVREDVQLQCKHRRASKKRKRTDDARRPTIATRLAYVETKMYWVLSFAFGYFFFCYGHGIFVLAMFGHDAWSASPWGELRQFAQLFTEYHLWWGLVGLAASHLFSFFANYIGKQEFRRTNERELASEPNGRIFALHFAIIVGGLLAQWFGGDWILVVLIIGKTVLDLKLHLREHARLSERAVPRQPTVPTTV